jgi:hypothetical protein
MSDAAKSEAERIRAQYAALTSHYRAIGPAAILAAVLAIKKRKQASTNKTA